MPRKKRRRRIEPADNHTPILTPPCCEAEGCSLFPLYGVELPALPRRVWLCATHWTYWRLDAARAKTRAWQKAQDGAWSERVERWLERCSPLVGLELERGLAPANRPVGWGARLRVGEVV